MYRMVTIVNNNVFYKRVGLKHFHVSALSEECVNLIMRIFSQLLCQIITLYTLKFYSFLFQLYFSKSGKKIKAVVKT